MNEQVRAFSGAERWAVENLPSKQQTTADDRVPLACMVERCGLISLCVHGHFLEL
jgi:hypothetical protein